MGPTPEDGDIASTTEDRLLDGRLILRQPHRGHRAGTDAILLSAALDVSAGGLLIDAGAGVGTAGLAAALRSPGIEAILIDIDPSSVALARNNATANGLSSRVRAIECDLMSAKSRRIAGLEEERADFVLANPPWHAPGRARVSPDADRARAHVAAAAADDPDGIDSWMRAIAALAKPDGRMAIIHRADAIASLIAGCAGRFGGLVILPVHPRATEAAIRVIVAGRKGSGAPLKIMPGLALHEANGRFTPRAEAIHRGEAVLDLG